MNKLLLLLPVSLLVAIGFLWATLEPTHTQTNYSASIQEIPNGVRELFSLNEHSLRKIVRHGDQGSISLINESFDAISTKLSKHKKEGYQITNLENILASYKEDSLFLTQKFTPRLDNLHRYDQFEHSHEKLFITSLEQIGLYELKSAYFELDTIRNRYLKEPTEVDKIAYERENQRIHQIIAELYLDALIEKPLFAYLDNHKLYFDTVSSAYNEIGYERIKRLRTNAYAIKSELQLLPSI